MTKILILLFASILMMGLAACEIKTPEIHGLVLDAETKQPVEGAWVRATAGIKSKTIAGDVGTVIALHPPHTRTGKDGKFLIPSRTFKKPHFPVGFGTNIDDLVVTAHTVDNQIGSITLEGEELKKLLKKKKVNVTLYRKPVEWKEEEYFSHLQTLFNYCLTGRYGIEVPPVEGGCDEWELDYIIKKHERYIDIYSEKIEKDANTVIFNNLSYLYDKKGNVGKAIEILKESVRLIERRGLLKFEAWQKNKEAIERKINELQKKLERDKK